MSKLSRIRAYTDAWTPDFAESSGKPSRVDRPRPPARHVDLASGLDEQSARTSGAPQTHRRQRAANGSMRRG